VCRDRIERHRPSGNVAISRVKHFGWRDSVPPRPHGILITSDDQSRKEEDGDNNTRDGADANAAFPFDDIFGMERGKIVFVRGDHRRGVVITDILHLMMRRFPRASARAMAVRGSKFSV
jgi:hypothetical protein